MYTITFLAIRAQRFEPTLQVLHDRDPTLNPRQSRHNKSIVSRHFIFFLTLYLFVLAILLLLGSAKGTYILALIVIVRKISIDFILIFQLDKQWSRWTCGASLALPTFLWPRFSSSLQTKKRGLICGELSGTIDQNPTLKLVVKGINAWPNYNQKYVLSSKVKMFHSLVFLTPNSHGFKNSGYTLGCIFIKPRLKFCPVGTN